MSLAVVRSSWSARACQVCGFSDAVSSPEDLPRHRLVAKDKLQFSDPAYFADISFWLDFGLAFVGQFEGRLRDRLIGQYVHLTAIKIAKIQHLKNRQGVSSRIESRWAQFLDAFASDGYLRTNSLARVEKF